MSAGSASSLTPVLLVPVAVYSVFVLARKYLAIKPTPPTPKHELPLEQLKELSNDAVCGGSRHGVADRCCGGDRLPPAGSHQPLLGPSGRSGALRPPSFVGDLGISAGVFFLGFGLGSHAFYLVTTGRCGERATVCRMDLAQGWLRFWATVALDGPHHRLAYRYLHCSRQTHAYHVARRRHANPAVRQPSGSSLPLLRRTTP